MFPKKLEPLLFSVILSGLMSLVVSGITTLRVFGAGPQFGMQWMAAWPAAWLVAFPAVMILAPFTRKLVGLMIGKDCPSCPR